MQVQSILKTKGDRVVTARPETTIAEAARLLSENRIGAVMVLSGDGRIAGVLSERDIVTAFARHALGVATMTVGELMTREVLTCAPDDTVESVMATMTGRRVRHLPVVREGKLIGIVSIGDVVKWRLDETASEADSLRQYVLAGR